MSVLRAHRFSFAVASVIALTLVGAVTLRAAEPVPVLGATVTSSVYASESRQLRVLNRSTVETTVYIEPSGGWGVDPAKPLILGPGETGSVTITGDGVDGARISVRLRASADPGVGRESAEILLGARVYTDRPASATPAWIVPLVLGLLLAVAVVARLLRRAAERPAARDGARRSGLVPPHV